MVKYINIVWLLFIILFFYNCSEKTYYSGKILDYNANIYNFTSKKQIIDELGNPNYIDPIEKKYYYFSEKKITKNFFDNNIAERILFVFHFNSDDTIININEYGLDNQNNIKFVKNETADEIIEQGLVEKIFGGVGKTPVE